MSAPANRRAQPQMAGFGWLVIAGIIAFLFMACGALWVGALVNPAIERLARRDLLSVLLAMANGSLPPTLVQGVVTALLLMILGVTAASGWLVWQRYTKGQSRVDSKSRSMAQKSDLVEMMEPAALEDARRLGAEECGPGVTVARHVGTNEKLFASFEWVQIWLMGPRAGKTSCVCIPQLIETKGPALATSNKRDIVDMARGARSEIGVVYVHDVQNIIGEPPLWWWNPLSFVTDMETAEKLADIFITSATAANAQQDAYFSSAAKETLSRLFLAAALGGCSILEVFRWANEPDPTTRPGTLDPATLLFEKGEQDQAKALRATQNLTSKQRDGVYGTMRPWISVLGSASVTPWITDPEGTRPQFDPEKFVLSTDTIFLISKEGGGSARAITGALTMAILIAAERLGALQPGGRLKRPLMGVLDEAANVCRWRELPDVYSHYGSRGIILSTFFQSWAQGAEAFGETGMAKLWSASNIRVAGRGLAEDKFLPFVSQLVGDHDVVKRSSSAQHKSNSVTTSLQRERIFEVSDLAGMPRGRAVMLASGIPAALIKLEHYSQRPYSQKIEESKKYYEQLGAATAQQQKAERNG